MKQVLISLLLLLAVAATAQNKNTFAVHFDLDKYNLTEDARTSLDSFIGSTKNKIKIKLYGHTDIMADYGYNDVLSLKRTHAVKEYLVKKGVDAASIIEEKGFGKRRPLNSNHGEWEMYLNRRVDIIAEGDIVINKLAKEPCAPCPAAKTLTEELEDTATLAGKNIVLQNMNFYGGTHTILPESLPILIELVKAMKKNPRMEIAVEGHICCLDGTGDGLDIGTRTFNLSENRAREICVYLNKNGIASSRLQYRGFGHSSPLNSYPEKTEEERVQNRRVEIKILKK